MLCSYIFGKRKEKENKTHHNTQSATTRLHSVPTIVPSKMQSTHTPRYQSDIHTTLPNRHPHHATKSTCTPRYQIRFHTTLPNPHPHHAIKSTSTPHYQIHIQNTLLCPHPHHATKSTSTTRYQIHIHNTLSHRSIVESAHNCQEGQTQSLKRSGPPSLC